MPHLSIYAPVDTTGFNNRSVQLMKKYKDLNFVNRAVNPTLQKLTLPDPDNPKGYMSHKMSYAEHDGQNFAFPGVVQDKGKLKYLPGIKGAKYAIQHKQLIPLGNDNNFADYFTTVGYKYNMNPDVYNEAMQDYIDNTSIKPGIPKFSFTPKPFVSSFTLKYKKGGKTGDKTENTLKDIYQNIVNPTSTSGILAKTAIQVFDPTGISSYPDVYDAGKTLYNNPTWANAGMFGLQTLGALPLIGKLAAPIKLAKGVSKLEKASKVVSQINRSIDTLPELLPLTRNFAKITQDVTSNGTNAIYKLVKTNNYNRNYNLIKKLNLSADVINTSGSLVNLSELLKLNNNSKKKFIVKNKKGGKTKNWIQSAVKPSHKGYCTPMSKPTCTPRRKALARTFKKMGKVRKHQFGGYLSPTPEYVLPKINFDALTQKFPSYLEQQQQPKKINTFSADEVLPILDKFEGFRPRVYKDGKGNLTIGHGLTDAKYLKRGFITRSDSLQGVKEHLNTQVLPKLESMSYWNNLNDNQKVALSSYVYNIGWNNFTKKSPNLQKALQSNDWNSVVKNLDFGYSDRANPGLRKRRDYERNLFLNSNETQTLKKGGNLTKDYIKVAEYHKYLESKHTK